ncbi:MAG TPA: VOC family protein [Candidatus Baltobacteraceae bacterium]|jgi:uncharacterized glyoxalase superfamily protein PhnB|nr:VOC family protein [Candidatus Baltobacteraceae bacterium]
MTLRLDHAAPILPAFAYDKSLAFFKSLGFDVTEYDRYAVMRMGGADIHLQATKDRSQSENSVCYLYVSNVDAFYSIALARGAVALQPPADREWGARECAVADPSGILLRVGTARKSRKRKGV